MIKFIKLTRVEGKTEAYVNVQNILYFNSDRHLTIIKFAVEGKYQRLTVEETPDQILQMINS